MARKETKVPDDDDDDDGLPPLGDGTADALEDAKKGRPRNFLLVVKGIKVRYLLARKKPIKKIDFENAKKAGYKGRPYKGVIQGRGMNLVFTLARADGYEEAPTKEMIFRKFLVDQIEFKCNPTFAIADEAPHLSFDEEDLRNPLIARFHELEKTLGRLPSTSPAIAKALKTLAAEIRDLLLGGDFGPAAPKVDDLQTRLAQAAGATTGAASSSADDSLKKLMAKLNKLSPKIKSLVASNPQHKDDILRPVARFQSQIQAKDEAGAKESLKRLATLLKTLSSGVATSATRSVFWSGR